MTTYAVVRTTGPAWDHARGLRDQELWHEHAAFMEQLVRECFVVMGGPVGAANRILLAVEAEDEHEVRTRLADDPWSHVDLLRIKTVEPWQILLRAGKRRTGAVGSHAS